MERHEEMRVQILADLKQRPTGRFYPNGVTDRLRTFIEDHIPEAEIIERGLGHIIRLKLD